MLSRNNYNPYADQCLEEEEIGRRVGELCLKEFLTSGKYNYQYQVFNTPLTCAVDLRGTVETNEGTLPFCIEIKQRNKTQEQLEAYPHVELRQDKLQRMYKEANKGTELLYMVLLNESECYIFNLKQIKWDQINRFEWHIKDVQVNSNSSYSSYTTYQIPFDQAIVKIDCREYFSLIHEKPEEQES